MHICEYHFTFPYHYAEDKESRSINGKKKRFQIESISFPLRLSRSKTHFSLGNISNFLYLAVDIAFFFSGSQGE